MFLEVELKEDVAEINREDLHKNYILLSCQSRVCKEEISFVGQNEIAVFTKLVSCHLIYFNKITKFTFLKLLELYTVFYTA